MSQGGFSLEQRRTVRLKRSNLLNARIDDIDRPVVKIAEDREEFKQAFSLLHDNYLRSGYLSAPKPHGMLFGVQSLLPQTVVFVAKANLSVISTLTGIFDTEQFGLPMDELYRRELDELRSRGRKIVELSALVTPAELRGTNIFMYVYKISYQYSLDHGANDVCIAVNPKHVRFYKHILLFEELGPERYYSKVNAPAVALRANMDEIIEKGKSAYDGFDFDSNVHAYLGGERVYSPPQRTSAVSAGEGAHKNGVSYWTPENVEYFLCREKSILDELSQPQRDFLLKSYPGLTIP